MRGKKSEAREKGGERREVGGEKKRKPRCCAAWLWFFLTSPLSPLPSWFYSRSRSVSRILSQRREPSAVVIHLEPMSPSLSSGLPGDPGSCLPARRATAFPLFGLAPGGVYQAVVSPRRQCALTAPFHPCRRGKRREVRCQRSEAKNHKPGKCRAHVRTSVFVRQSSPLICDFSDFFSLASNLFSLTSFPNGGVFSVALSVGLPRLPVRKHRALWCSDFPLRSAFIGCAPPRVESQRPPDRLHF